MERERQRLATHHALLAHGMAVKSIRARAKKKPLVGWAPVGWFYYPVSDKPEDVEAGRRATMRVADGWNNCWYADPVILGRYPEDGLRAFGSAVPSSLRPIWKQCASRWISMVSIPTRAFPPRPGPMATRSIPNLLRAIPTRSSCGRLRRTSSTGGRSSWRNATSFRSSSPRTGCRIAIGLRWMAGSMMGPVSTISTAIFARA